MYNACWFGYIRKAQAAASKMGGEQTLIWSSMSAIPRKLILHNPQIAVRAYASITLQA